MTLVEDLRRMVKSLHSTNVHDSESWYERGETMGRGAVATITTEGELYEAINFHRGLKAYNKASEQLDAIAARHGCWWELGYAWSIHFYTKE